MEITKDTRLADLIDQYPWLKTEMAKVNGWQLLSPKVSVLFRKSLITSVTSISGGA